MGSFTNSGGTFASDSTLGVVAITNPGNAQISDNSYATAILLITQISNYLKVTNFGFNIPLDATITGITVSVERSSNTLNGTHDNSVRLVKAGVISGNDKASANLWPTSDGTATYGSSSDLWGLSFTPVDVNLSTFGFVIDAVADLASTMQIDFVSMTVDYTGSNRGTNMNKYLRVGDGMGRNEGN